MRKLLPVIILFFVVMTSFSGAQRIPSQKEIDERNRNQREIEEKNRKSWLKDYADKHNRALAPIKMQKLQDDLNRLAAPGSIMIRVYSDNNPPPRLMTGYLSETEARKLLEYRKCMNMGFQTWRIFRQIILLPPLITQKDYCSAVFNSKGSPQKMKEKIKEIFLKRQEEEEQRSKFKYYNIINPFTRNVIEYRKKLTEEGVKHYLDWLGLKVEEVE